MGLLRLVKNASWFRVVAASAFLRRDLHWSHGKLSLYSCHFQPVYRCIMLEFHSTERINYILSGWLLLVLCVDTRTNMTSVQILRL